MAREFTFGAGPERLKRLLFEGLEEPERQEDVTQSLSDHTPKPEGEWIGRYHLVHTIGEGGMGIVYLAEQHEPIRRKVALKVIKPGMDSKRVIARFEAERQALALLDYPNIAHVYDAGKTETGRPYFVMEYVKGLPITDYCDHHKLNINERLQLFQQVCQAVQQAHQKGIIHRDIKPSNVIVSADRNNAIPKIIDFGVAKALAQPLTERTLATEESQLLGTPEYMSPEQADPFSVDIDTRSDIYSLGILLYVLLTGVLPFDSDTLRTGGIDHIRKIIRETDPKTPSTRLTKLGEDATAIAQNRRVEINTLAKYLKKELEWIPLKAMRKERTERYRSASELADDIENYLKGEPLIAGPPGIGYRLNKFVRRNHVLVGGIAAVLIVLIVGVVISTILAIGQARARSEAQLIADFLQNDVLGSADKARIDEATVSFILDAASKTLDEGKFKDKPLIEASICRTLGETYWRLGEYKRAEQHLLQAIRIYRQHHSEEHLDTLKAEFFIGWVYEQQGRYSDMERQWTRILPIQQHIGNMEDQLATMNGLAMAYYHLGKYEEAETLYHKILQTVRREMPEENVLRLSFWKSNLATVYTAQGRYKEAERLFVEGQASLERAEDGRLAELANLYREQGQYDEAESLFSKTLEMLRQRRGDEHFVTVWCMELFVRLYLDQDRYEDAKALLDEALPIAHRRMRPEHPVTLRLMNARAVLYTKQKQYDEAKELFDEALKGRIHELGEDHPDMLESEHDLAVLYIKQGHYNEAEPLLLEAVKGRRLKLGDTHPHTLESWKNLIELYEAWGKPEKANEWREKLPQTKAVDE